MQAPVAGAAQYELLCTFWQVVRCTSSTKGQQDLREQFAGVAQLASSSSITNIQDSTCLRICKECGIIERNYRARMGNGIHSATLALLQFRLCGLKFTPILDGLDWAV